MNSVTVKRENGEDIKIEIILSFEVKELNKQYIAYTLNDDGVKEDVCVLISEIDNETKKIKNIPDNEKDIVLNIYNQIKNNILE